MFESKNRKFCIPSTSQILLVEVKQSFIGRIAGTDTLLLSIYGEDPLAIMGVRHAFEIKPELEEYLRYSRRISQIIKTSPNINLARHHLELGQFYQQIDGEYAVEHFQSCIAASPDESILVQAYSKLGETLSTLGPPEPAIKAFESALEIDPTHLNSLIKMASLYKSMRCFADGAKYFQVAIDLDPNDTESILNKALCVYSEREEIASSPEELQEAQTDLDNAFARANEIRKRLGLI